MRAEGGSFQFILHPSYFTLPQTHAGRGRAPPGDSVPFSCKPKLLFCEKAQNQAPVHLKTQ